MAPLSMTSEPVLATTSVQCIADKKLCSQEIPPAKRSVSFHGRVRCRNSIHLNDFSDDEIDACWYSDTEYSNMEEEIRFLSTLIDQGQLELEDSSYCLRGAESHTALQSSRRHEVKLAVVGEVIREQALQWAEGSSDPEYIAHVSQIKSIQSLEYARRMALEDELAAAL